MKTRAEILVSVLALAALLLAPYQAGAALSCSLTTTCNSPSVVVMRLSSTTNAHAQLPSESSYPELVCCSGTSLNNTCAGTHEVVLRLSSTTNAHVEENTQSNYANDACLSVGAGSLTVAYQASNCSGYDTTIASISSTTNAHAGGPGAYTTKVCGTAALSQSLSLSISDNNVGFGQLINAERYATGDGAGDFAETEAHSITVNSTAAAGYVLTVQGGSLRGAASGHVIAPIGNTATPSIPGTEQFGLHFFGDVVGGLASAPYDTGDFGYGASATSSDEIGTGLGDGTDDIYSVVYLANIAPSTPADLYSTALTYVVTANF